jgi:hypothetical protein
MKGTIGAHFKSPASGCQQAGESAEMENATALVAFCLLLYFNCSELGGLIRQVSSPA